MRTIMYFIVILLNATREVSSVFCRECRCAPDVRALAIGHVGCGCGLAAASAARTFAVAVERIAFRAGALRRRHRYCRCNNNCYWRSESLLCAGRVAPVQRARACAARRRGALLAAASHAPLAAFLSRARVPFEYHEYLHIINLLHVTYIANDSENSEED